MMVATTPHTHNFLLRIPKTLINHIIHILSAETHEDGRIEQNASTLGAIL